MKAITTERRAHYIKACDSDGNRARYTPQGEPDVAAHANAVETLCKKMGWAGTLAGGHLAPGKMVWLWIAPGTPVMETFHTPKMKSILTTL